MAHAKLTEKCTISVTLTLDKDEAETLKQILGHIGGHPDKTARKFTNQIENALNVAGVKESKHIVANRNRAIYFED